MAGPCLSSNDGVASVGGSGSPGHVHTCRPPAPDADPKVTTAQEGGPFPSPHSCLLLFLSPPLSEESCPPAPPTPAGSQGTEWTNVGMAQRPTGVNSPGGLSPLRSEPSSLCHCCWRTWGFWSLMGTSKHLAGSSLPALSKRRPQRLPPSFPPPPTLTFPAPPPQLSHPFPACSFSPVPCSLLWPLPQPRIPGGAGKNGPAHPPPLPA